ncbi:MAG: Lrp/AsnC family transcriptional regulator, partial [Phycisphaerae bacterium]|nr:Lrp/AsnC family transcriptional regulator [Phycisphaerae bacterium]
ILTILRDNARITNAEIARRVQMAPSAVLERVRKLEDRGVIRSYETRLAPRQVGLGLTTFILVQSGEGLGENAVGERLAKLPQVQEVHFMAGEFCYLLKVRVRDTDALGDLLQTFGRLGVKDTRTMLVLHSIKESLEIDLTGAVVT